MKKEIGEDPIDIENKTKIELDKILKHENLMLKNERLIKYILIVTEGFSIICTMYVLITVPYKNIVDSLQSNILISGLSLLSFSLMFLTLFLNDYFDKDRSDKKYC